MMMDTRILSETIVNQMCVVVYTNFNTEGDKIETAVGIFDSFESAEEYATKHNLTVYEIVRFELLIISNLF